MPTALSADQPIGDLSLREATVLYAVALRTLRTKVGCGEIVGYKVRGVRGREWRVTRDALELSGYGPRPATGPGARPDDTRDGTEPDDTVVVLQAELAVARRTAALERRRADAADRELGYALLECGRLRAAVAGLQRDRAPAR